MRQAANKVITVEQAELKTATVEISHVVVNARKMTLSVFRQIPEEKIIMDTDDQKFALAGVPWGLINYYWGNMNESSIHVLWQKGKELRRSLVSACEQIKKQKTNNYHDELVYCDMRVEDVRAAFFSSPPDADQISRLQRNQSLRMTGLHKQIPVYAWIDGISADIKSFRADGSQTWKYHRSFPESCYIVDGLNENLQEPKYPNAAPYDSKEAHEYSVLMDEFRAALRENEEIAKSVVTDDILEKLEEINAWQDATVERENNRRKNYNSIVADLTAMPQLFIAV